MAIIKYKPTSPARRFMTVTDYSVITTNEPEKSLTTDLRHKDVYKRQDTGTGDTLCAENQQVVLESMTFPEPVIRVAIEPKTKAGQDKMTIALVKLAEEDPTFKAYTDQAVSYTHLDVYKRQGHHR